MNDSPARLIIRLLGAPQVQVAGKPLALNHLKAQALLFYLAVSGQPHTRDHLATLLWSESPTSDARHSLRSSLYRLRLALRYSGAVSIVTIAGDQVQLRLDEDECDVTHFRRLLSTGGESALAQAVALYRGPLLQGFTVADAPLFEEWMQFEETRLSEAYLDALDRLATWAEARQEWATAIDYVQRIVQFDPLAETAQRRLMRLYLHEDAIGLALRQYQQLKALLRQELGLTPSPETRALFQQVLEQHASATHEVASPTRQFARRPQLLPFVGRNNELTRLLAISQDIITGRGVTVLLQGEAGIGKSRLLDELADNLSVASPTWLVLRGNCSPFDDLLSYGPFLEALQSVAADDLADLLAESSQSAPDARGRFFWQVLQTLRALATGAPLLLAIDDLHWANSSTLNLFSFLATRLHDVPVMLVGTVEPAAAIPSLQRLLALGRRRGELHLLSLAPLSLETVNALLKASSIGPGAATMLAEWLHERSGGSPFILAEILAHLRTEAILTPAEDGWQLDLTRWLRWRATFTLPETTYDLVDWRLANLPPTARHLLDVLAVSGQLLPFALLRQFPDIEADQLLSTVDDLVARGFIIESSDEMIALPHHLMREALLHRLSNLRRRTIHRQLAEALEACPALQTDLRQIALHAVAGEDIPRARRYGLQVLADLSQDYVGIETVDFIHHLHDLLAPTASPDEMLHLTRVLGRLHQSLGQLETAAHWQRRNLDIAQEMGDPSARAAAYFEIGELALVTNDYAAAMTAAQAGLSRIESEGNTTQDKALAPDPQTLALMGRGHRLMGAALAMQGSDLATADRHLQQAVTTQRIIGNLSDLCATLFELGNVTAQRGELERAIEFYEEAGRAAKSGHVHYFLALAHNNLAYHDLLLGRPEAAQQAVEQGLKLAEIYGMLGALQYLYSTQGEINMYLGEWAAAADSFQRGLALAEELGHLERQAGYRAGLALVARDHQGDLERAVTLLKEALALINGQGYEHLRTEIRLWLAETLLRLDHAAEARLHLESALVTARTHGRTLLTIQGERLRAQLLARSGDWRGANALFAETLNQASRSGLPLEVARTQAAWGRAALRYSPNPDEGRTLLAQARTTLTAHGARAELHTLASDLQ
jgi:DNA-binding SARP family transcriptional activator